MPKLYRSKLMYLIFFSIAAAVFAAACGGSPSSPGGGSQSIDRGDAELGLTEAEVTKRVDAVESLIGTCMSEAGFEYFPVDYPTARKAMDSNSKPSGMKSDDFRKQFGYGITTLVSSPDSQATLGLGPRNISVRNQLPTADRIAYQRTLFGENPAATFVVSLDHEDFSQTGGCTRAAVVKVFSTDELGASFVNYQDAAAARVDQDPRVIAAYRDWGQCISDAGYRYGTPGEIEVDLSARLDAITGNKNPETLSADLKLALAELQGEEKAIAAVDHQCELDFVDAVKVKVENELLGPGSQK